MLTENQRGVVEAFVQALLYGIYLATFIQCIRWFIFADEGWKRRERIHSPAMAVVTIFIFLTSTTNLIFTLQYMLGYFPLTYMIGDGIAMTISGSLTLLSIDGVMIYRCWVVYGKSWRAICLPVIFWLGLLACWLLYLYCEGICLFNSAQCSDSIEQIGLKVLITSYGCNIATSIYTTAAMIYRIRGTMKSSSSSSKRLSYVMRIVAESATLYTFTAAFNLVGMALLLITYSTWVELLIGDTSTAINISMAGIAFNLLVIRVNESRVEIRDSLADSGNDVGERSLSGIQFNNPQITMSSEVPGSEVPASDAPDGVINEEPGNRVEQSKQPSHEAPVPIDGE